MERKETTPNAKRAKGAILQNLSNPDIVLGFGQRISNSLKDLGDFDARESIERGGSLILVSRTHPTHPTLTVPNIRVRFGVEVRGAATLRLSA